MAKLRNGRNTECFDCGYTVSAEGEQLTLEQLTELLEESPPDTFLTFDCGGAPTYSTTADKHQGIGAGGHQGIAMLRSPYSAIDSMFEDALYVSEHAGKLRRKLEDFPDQSEYPVWAGRGSQHEFDFINILKVVGVNRGPTETQLALCDWEGREPVCPVCGSCGPWGPGQLTLDDLIAGLSSFERDLPVVMDRGGHPHAFRGFRDTRNYLSIKPHLDVGLMSTAWTSPSFGERPTVGSLIDDLTEVEDSSIEYYKGEDILIGPSSPIWCGQRMVVGISQQRDGVCLATSSARWVSRS